MGKIDSGFRSKVLTIAITLAMLMSGVILSGGEAEAASFENELDSILSNIDPDDFGTGQDVSLVDIRAPPYYRPAFTDKNNQLELTLKNDGGLLALVKVDLYHIEPDKVTESFLKTTRPYLIFSSQEKTFNVFKHSEEMWQPTQIGRNWIRGEIFSYVLGQGWVQVSEFRESFWVVPGSRPIVELGDTLITEDTVWENLTVIVDGDVTVNEGAELSTPRTDVFSDDLNVSGWYNITAGYIHNMECSSDGQYSVRINSTGVLNVWGNLTNDPDTKHYWFYMNGTLNINKQTPFDEPGLVEFTYGDTSNLSNPGGIICTTPNVNI